MERGKIKLDAAFFKGFTEDLHNRKAWQEFNTSFRNQKKKLKDTLNPTQLGDHVSLKAKASDSRPTDRDWASKAGPSDEGKEDKRHSLSKLAKDTTIGDPVSLESEDVVQPDEDRKSQDRPPRKVFISSSQTLNNGSLPQMPTIDGESLFWGMMSASREPDPYVFPALERVLKQNPRPIIGALSNTVEYPPDHPWSKSRESVSGSTAFFFDPESYFDIYVASADAGMRKPSREIYELAMQKLTDHDKQKGGDGIEPEEVVFLDDIGENLKTAKDVGMKTIRVQLGKTWRAVKELEEMLGIDLMDPTTRRSKL